MVAFVQAAAIKRKAESLHDIGDEGALLEGANRPWMGSTGRDSCAAMASRIMHRQAPLISLEQGVDVGAAQAGREFLGQRIIGARPNA